MNNAQMAAGLSVFYEYFVENPNLESRTKTRRIPLSGQNHQTPQGGT